MYALSIASFMMNNLIDCSPLSEILCRTRRFKDMPAAINYIHSYLPAGMELQEKCKRYAALLSLAPSVGVPYESNAFRVLTMDQDSLNERYNEIGIKCLEQSYMLAIEGYRVRQLSPPFLEIIECLRQIDTPEAKAYLETEELTIIIDLYEQTLGAPPKKVDLRSIDLSTFRHEIRRSIQFLFSDYFEHFGYYRTGENCTHLTDVPSSSTNAPTKGKKDKQKNRDLLMFRRRERARLAQQRLRAIHPEQMREDCRKRQQLRREKLKQARERMEQDALKNPEQLRTPLHDFKRNPDRPKMVRKAQRQQRQARKARREPTERQRILNQKQATQLQQLEQLRFLKDHDYMKSLLSIEEIQNQQRAHVATSSAQQVQFRPIDSRLDTRTIPLFTSIANNQASFRARSGSSSTYAPVIDYQARIIDDPPRQPILIAGDRRERYDQAGDSSARDDEGHTTMWSHEPESRGESDTNRDPLRCSTQPDDMDIISQYFNFSEKSDPKNSTDPGV